MCPWCVVTVSKLKIYKFGILFLEQYVIFPYPIYHKKPSKSSKIQCTNRVFSSKEDCLSYTNIAFDPIKEMRLSNQKRITNQFSILFSKHHNSLAGLCQQLIHICDMFDFRDFLRHPHNQTQSMYQINSKVNDFFCYQIGKKCHRERILKRGVEINNNNNKTLPSYLAKLSYLANITTQIAYFHSIYRLLKLSRSRGLVSLNLLLLLDLKISVLIENVDSHQKERLLLKVSPVILNFC